MALEIKKDNKETSQSLLRRFSKAVQRSGILTQKRRARFKTRKKSDQMKQKAALRREEKRKEYERLKKLGKPEE